MKNYEERNLKDRSINLEITKTISKCLNEQNITNKTVMSAMVETRSENKIYSSNNNFYAEIILLGDKQIIVTGFCIQHIEFTQRFVVKSYPALYSKSLCETEARGILELSEELNKLYEEGPKNAA
jgi:hypothetical protein